MHSYDLSSMSSDVLMDPKTLPLQVFTTAASLLELVDKKVVLTLRDGRALSGVLRSFDAFGNLVIQNTVEKIYLDGKYAETKRGVWIIRGENVALVGEIDLAKEEALESHLSTLEKISFEQAESELEALKQSYDNDLERNKDEYLSKGLVYTRVGNNPYLY